MIACKIENYDERFATVTILRKEAAKMRMEFEELDASYPLIYERRKPKKSKSQIPTVVTAKETTIGKETPIKVTPEKGIIIPKPEKDSIIPEEDLSEATTLFTVVINLADINSKIEIATSKEVEEFLASLGTVTTGFFQKECIFSFVYYKPYIEPLRAQLVAKFY